MQAEGNPAAAMPGSVVEVTFAVGAEVAAIGQ
jgi:hypothetical protein